MDLLDRLSGGFLGHRDFASADEDRGRDERAQFYHEAAAFDSTGRVVHPHPRFVEGTPMSAGVLILGAGQAAAQLAISLRQGGYAGPIRMVGDEPYPPYQRPPLSKAFLKERPAGRYAAAAPRGLLGRPRGHPRTRHAGGRGRLAHKRVTLRDGRSFDYDTLVFATGTRARDLPLPGIGLAGVFSLRKIDDVRRLRPALDGARRVVIVGGGYIGLEVAAVHAPGGPRRPSWSRPKTA